MILAERNGYVARLPETGGKAGKGQNKTSSLQVLKDNLIVKQFRFTMNNPESWKAAVAKANQFMDAAS